LGILQSNIVSFIFQILESFFQPLNSHSDSNAGRALPRFAPRSQIFPRLPA
jgi:hypothetical protein